MGIVWAERKDGRQAMKKKRRPMVVLIDEDIDIGKELLCVRFDMWPSHIGMMAKIVDTTFYFGGDADFDVQFVGESYPHSSSIVPSHNSPQFICVDGLIETITDWHDAEEDLRVLFQSKLSGDYFPVMPVVFKYNSIIRNTAKHLGYYDCWT